MPRGEKQRDIKEWGRTQVTVIWDKAEQYWPLIWRPWASRHLFYEYGRALWDLSSWEEEAPLVIPAGSETWQAPLWKPVQTGHHLVLPSNTTRHDFQTDPWTEKGTKNQSDKNERDDSTLSREIPRIPRATGSIVPSSLRKGVSIHWGYPPVGCKVTCPVAPSAAKR